MSFFYIWLHFPIFPIVKNSLPFFFPSQTLGKRDFSQFSQYFINHCVICVYIEIVEKKMGKLGEPSDIKKNVFFAFGKMGKSKKNMGER
jgi:hypothetical protein